jgi:hypothetical protein
MRDIALRQRRVSMVTSDNTCWAWVAMLIDSGQPYVRDLNYW